MAFCNCTKKMHSYYYTFSMLTNNGQTCKHRKLQSCLTNMSLKGHTTYIVGMQHSRTDTQRFIVSS